jgi:hypothetical protein
MIVITDKASPPNPRIDTHLSDHWASCMEVCMWDLHSRLHAGPQKQLSRKGHHLCIRAVSAARSACCARRRPSARGSRSEFIWRASHVLGRTESRLKHCGACAVHCQAVALAAVAAAARCFGSRHAASHLSIWLQPALLHAFSATHSG